MKDALAQALLPWFVRHGRHELPWQQAATPYRVWVSEIMLQQTQVSTVIAYFERFMDSFPTLQALAQAPLDRVLSHWAGLGYYARAHRLHACAQAVVQRHDGQFPEDLEALIALPGIGRSTAGAIRALGHGSYGVILDGNVRRVLARYHALELDARSSAGEKMLWRWAQEHTPEHASGPYAQAMMDLGATVCKPRQAECSRCPLQDHCQAHLRDEVTSYPRSKSRGPHPQRRRCALLIKDTQGRIWLQKRPNHGLWAGLYSWPECEPDAASLKAALARYSLSAAQVERIDQIKHDFTHYHLQLDLMAVAGTASIADEPGLWYAYGDEKPALPAPIERYLDKRCKSE